MSLFPNRPRQRKSSLLAEFDEEVALQAAARDDAERAPPLMPWSASAEPLVAEETPVNPPMATRPAAAQTEPRSAPVAPPPAIAPTPPSGHTDPPIAADALVRPPPLTGPAPQRPQTKPEPLLASVAPASPQPASPIDPTPGLGSIDARIGRSRLAKPRGSVFAVAAAMALLAGGGAWVAGHHPALPAAMPRTAAPPAQSASLVPTPAPAARSAPVPRVIAPPAPDIAAVPAPEAAPVAKAARRTALAEAAVPARPTHPRPVALAVREPSIPPRASETRPSRASETRPPLAVAARATVAPAPVPQAGEVQLATNVQPRRTDDEPAGKRASRRAAIDAIRALQMR